MVDETPELIDRSIEKGPNWVIGAAFGLLAGLLVFGVMALVYLGGALLLGWGASAIIPAFQGVPTLPLVMILTGVVLLIGDMIYMLFRPNKLRQNLFALYELIPVQKTNEFLTPEQYHHSMRAMLRGMILSMFIIIVAFESAYAAAVSWGLQTMYPDLTLFAGTNNPSPVAHFIFWLGVPFELFLLDAPSLFGFNLSDLSPNREVIGLLIGVFVFKTILVATSIRLFLEAIRFKALDPDEGLERR